MYSVTFVTSAVDYTYRVSAVNATHAVIVAKQAFRREYPVCMAKTHGLSVVSI